MARKEPAPTESPCCSPGDACSSRPALADRPHLSFVEAVKVMALFKVMANDTRIRMLHHLVRSGEATVTGPASPDASSTSCGGLSIPGSDLGPGVWSAVVSYESGSSRASSDPVEVEIP